MACSRDWSCDRANFIRADLGVGYTPEKLYYYSMNSKISGFMSLKVCLMMMSLFNEIAS